MDENTKRHADALASDMNKDCIVETTTGEIEEMNDGMGELMEDIENALSNAQSIVERGEGTESFVLIRVTDSSDEPEEAATADTAS